MRGRLGGALLVACAAAVPAAGQSTGTPIYAAPYRAFDKSEIGLSLADPGPGLDFEASYRLGFSSRIDAGVRGGFHSGPGASGKTTDLAGVDFRARIVEHSESFPLDGSLTLGLGMESGQGTTVGFLPIGFSMGRRVLVEGSSISIVPYIEPVLTPIFGDATGTDFSFGFGVDVRLVPRLDLRFSGAVGDRHGVGFTAAFLR